MKTIIWVSIIALTMVSTVYAKETYTDLSNVQFRVECSDSIGNKTTYANEPQKTEYFLYGPNVRIRDKGVMDLGAYKKGTIRLVRGGVIPDRVEIAFSSEGSIGIYGKPEKWFYKATYFNYKTLTQETTVFDNDNNLDGVIREDLNKCLSIWLPW